MSAKASSPAVATDRFWIDKKELTVRNIAAICWLTHEIRTESYAGYLGARLYNIHYLSNRSPIYAPFKYLLQCLKTWSVLLRQRPQVIYVMNPPVFAALSVYFYCLFCSTPFLLDTHSPSLYARKWRWSVPLQRWLARKALLNIVDQERFQQLFEAWGAQSVILERPPLEVKEPPPKRDPHSMAFSIVVIGTFASDEPVEIIISAASRLPDVEFTVLGDTAKAPMGLLRSSPSNVTYPGFLTGSEYWSQLQTADAVMAVTTYAYSLLGGAQEGMVLGKPLILSRQPALMEYFHKGAVFVEHTASSMVSGILETQRREAELRRECAALAVEKRARWNQSFEILIAAVVRGTSA